MAKYRILTGPYAGEIVEEGQILPSRFAELDEDMQIRVREWAETRYSLNSDESDFPVSLDQLVEEYENSWDSEEIEEDNP